MGLQSTSEYPCQAWAVAILSFAACLLGLGQIAVGIWYYIYSIDFKLILGVPLHNVYIGYAALGLFTFLCGAFGAGAALLRRKLGLIVYAVFLVACIVCQGGVWAFMYIEQREPVDTAVKGKGDIEARQSVRLSGAIKLVEGASGDFANKIVQHPQYYDFIDRQFNCDLSLYTSNSTAANSEAEKCSNFFSNRLWTVTWAMLGICAILICLQFILIWTAIMLHQLVKEALRKAAFRVSTPVSDLDTTSCDGSYEASTTTAMRPRAANEPQGFIHNSWPRPQPRDTAIFVTISSTPGYIDDNEQQNSNPHYQTRVHRTVLM